MTTIDRLRYLNDNAAGEAFLPPAWQELVAAIPALLDVAEAARALSRMNEGDVMCCEMSIHTRGAAHHGCQWHDLSAALARLDEA